MQADTEQRSQGDPHNAPINVLSRAQAELRPLSQRIVSEGPAWLSQGGSVALLTCQYAHVKICDKQDYRVQSEVNEWYQWQQAKKINVFLFALVSCFQLADFIMCLSSSLKGFTYHRAKSTAKDFIGSPYQTRKELPVALLSDAWLLLYFCLYF